MNSILAEAFRSTSQLHCGLLHYDFQNGIQERPKLNTDILGKRVYWGRRRLTLWSTEHGTAVGCTLQGLLHCT